MLFALTNKSMLFLLFVYIIHKFNRKNFRKTDFLYLQTIRLQAIFSRRKVATALANTVCLWTACMLQAKHMRNFYINCIFSLLLVCTSLSTASILSSILVWAYLASSFVLLSAQMASWSVHPSAQLASWSVHPSAQLAFCFLSFSENSRLLVFPWVADCFLQICNCRFPISSGLWDAVQCSTFLKKVLSKFV